MDYMGEHMNTGIIPVNQLTIHPDFLDLLERHVSSSVGFESGTKLKLGADSCVRC